MGPLCPHNPSIFLFPRERLEVGCCQLAQLEHMIKQCHASVHTEAKNRGWLWHRSRCGAAVLAPCVFLLQAKPSSSGVWGKYSRSQKICLLFSRWCCFLFELKEKNPTSYICTLNVRISAKNHKLTGFSVSSEVSGAIQLVWYTADVLCWIPIVCVRS